MSEHNNDRTKRNATSANPSFTGSGQPRSQVDRGGAASAPSAPTRQRASSADARASLRSSFRVVPRDGAVSQSANEPVSQPSQPLASRSADRGTPAATLGAAPAGPDRQPASPARPDNLARRNPAVPPGQQPAPAVRSTVAEDESAGGRGGGVRGRQRASANGTAGATGTSKKKQPAPSIDKTAPITHPLAQGTRVFVIAPDHPWNGHAGEVISEPEQYGLGWWGQRVRLDGNAGETFLRPEESRGVRVATGSNLDRKTADLTVASAQPVAPKYIPTESERADARRLFREIGRTFNLNRKKSKTAAYTQYRHDLMDNLDTLIMGGAIDLKEVTTVITNLEALTKETEQESTETPATLLGRWLRMTPVETAGLVERVRESGENGETEEEAESEEVRDDSADQLSGQQSM